MGQSLEGMWGAGTREQLLLKGRELCHPAEHPAEHFFSAKERGNEIFIRTSTKGTEL